MSTAIPIDRKSLLEGFKLPITIDSVSPPVFIKLKDGKIYVTAEIFDLENKIVARMVNNEWNAPNRNMQVNYDNVALEVVDDYDLPRLQVEFIDSKTFF